MTPDSVRSVAARLEQYFEWYVRVDPEVPSAVWTLLSRFHDVVEHPENREAAQELLDDTRGFTFGSPWEELRLTLSALAQPA